MIKEERRIFDVEVRAIGDEAPKIVGHAALFNTRADIGYFTESIDPGAFADSIKTDDVRALFNHDPNLILGRNKAKTLKLAEDNKGLAIEIDPPDTQLGRDLMYHMKRGDITQMSFGFQVIGQRIERADTQKPHRALTKVRLFDVSPVTYPAYDQTDVSVRSAAEVFDDIVAEELALAESRKDVKPDTAPPTEALIENKEIQHDSIPATETPAPESVREDPRIDLYRRRLQLVG